MQRHAAFVTCYILGLFCDWGEGRPPKSDGERSGGGGGGGGRGGRAGTLVALTVCRRV